MKTNVSAQAKKLLTFFGLCALIATPVWAATRTVTLSVPGMTCVTCPFTVRAALSRVEGVRKTDVQFGKREADVTFDDAKTTVQLLMDATGNAGYPSTVKN
ncbi:MAG: mercury resistance system periplasmic binding protein MerP [Polaromonas sp.]|uniref:mercury resistance system periplasmic binding protein MerP n=1 Tax=Polaromonas sp. TaxID=1869339 RepID=UPI00272FE661|nr:mercury resistance system periplasmic binding protein MerP [Polaromonas sp.]MDP2256182.1 mercury resistance system periplasmic binding protein MerP [Polaromonas sp.]MDP3706996.1 mercury resistance system periplasmic binding protein MerP [Polaromonas sp.]